MTEPSRQAMILDGLNAQQRAAVVHGEGPLLIIAGAGTGKTRTLVHRVADLIARGVPPARILLLTFTRRAAAEMLRRVESLLQTLSARPACSVVNRTGPFDQVAANIKEPLVDPAPPLDSLAGSLSPGAHRLVWGGTFHATAARLLRIHGPAAGLDPDFTILDRSDAEDLLDVARTELGLSKSSKRFPRKGTCLAIYSHCVNSVRPLEEVLEHHFPWCRDEAKPLKELFRAYGQRKEQAAILDYDDLLLFWRGLLADPLAGAGIRERFDHVLVDEYQDTNRVQADILRGLRPDGQGLTAVGDDAQSIYAFRAATIRNILDFPTDFPGTEVIKLEQNYRSTQAILSVTNAVIAQASERVPKDLWTQRVGGERPGLVTCQDETQQAQYVVNRILQRREEGIALMRQAVLYRASHHSILLEGELARRNVPYVKYGGLKFIESAHVKDLMAFLRLAENPRDVVAGSRLLSLLPGIGPVRARQLMDQLIDAGGRFAIWSEALVPAAAQPLWAPLQRLFARLTAGKPIDVPAQIRLVREFYEPILQQRYDHAGPRQRDLEQIEQLASRFPDRQTLLTQMALDPPESTEDDAGPPLLDEDYLILSTIHSAKGLEWDAVYVIHAADGNIPSDMATGSQEEIDEELRLFYVALTRAKHCLDVCHPQRYYHASRGAFSDRHSYAQRTRFLPKPILHHFHIADTSADDSSTGPAHEGHSANPATSRLIRSQIQELWS
jgi:DNA helicase II / ATP-dependent DNA helicase PcrA